MTNAQILSELRPAARQEASAAPYFLETAAQNSWQWGLTEGGKFIAGMSVHEDVIAGRGWFVAFPSKHLNSPFQVRPMFKLFDDLARLGPYTELRAWVLAGADREERFAKWFGFELDCGPASGFSPTGQDMNLFLWRRKQ
jgi:hypothetical protein